MKSIGPALMAQALSLYAADLPVKTVILYKNGVGYFERAGELRAGESARLDFKASEMNDVLKSLTIEDKAGGKVVGVRYDSSEPLEKKLGEYPFQLGAGKPLSLFLDQLKGARLELKIGSETIAGAIVGARVIGAQAQQPEREVITLLVDTGDLRMFDLHAAAAVRLEDVSLQQKLKDYLAAMSGARSQDKRSVYVDSTDAKARQLVASYMVPTPVWKSSYRLIFPETGDPALEGWAIIDNTSGEDWTNVKLALVSGRPVSFISKLYEPKYRVRPEVELPEDRAQGPVVYSGAIREELQQGAVAGFARARKAMAAPPPAPSAPAAMADMAMERVDISSSIAAAAEGRDLGDLFEYRFSNPVTVRKSESAMLPFLQQKLQARKLLIYSDRSTQNPMNAAELTNSTGKTLDGGPITVFDSNAYAGEALVETVKTGDKRLISYGVDLGTRITIAFDSTSNLMREIHVNRGILTSKMAAQETLTYTIRNVDAKAKTLIIEHPVRPGYTLLNVRAAETTANAWRFEVKLPGNATEKFSVPEERVYVQTTSVASLTPDVLLTWIENKTLSDAGRRQLQQVAAKKQQIAEVARDLHGAETEINQISQDQERVRRNIESLNRVTGQQEQVQKYARDLAASESRLATVRDRQADLQKRKSALESELNSLIEKMEF